MTVPTPRKMAFLIMLMIMGRIIHMTILTTIPTVILTVILMRMRYCRLTLRYV